MGHIGSYHTHLVHIIQTTPNVVLNNSTLLRKLEDAQTEVRFFLLPDSEAVSVYERSVYALESPRYRVQVADRAWKGSGEKSEGRR